MQSVRRAVIDIGTNSVKLLVADVNGRVVQAIIEESKQTRLGQGFYETRRLQAPTIAATAKAVAEFADAARSKEAKSIRVFATSAARDAVNQDDLTHEIQRISGLRVDVITGDTEADWVFQGVTTDPSLRAMPLLILDVGGGSTEFIIGEGDEIRFRSSFPIGSVRLLDKFPPADPPKPAELDQVRQWVRDFLTKDVRPQLGPALARESAAGEHKGDLQLVGTGGTASILGRMEANLETYDRERLEQTRLSLVRLRWHLHHLWSLSLEQRREIIGLPKNRADIILMGVALYEGIMTEFGFNELRISTRGLRFAAVMQTV